MKCVCVIHTCSVRFFFAPFARNCCYRTSTVDTYTNIELFSVIFKRCSFSFTFSAHAIRFVHEGKLHSRKNLCTRPQTKSKRWINSDHQINAYVQVPRTIVCNVMRNMNKILFVHCTYTIAMKLNVPEIELVVVFVIFFLFRVQLLSDWSEWNIWFQRKTVSCRINWKEPFVCVDALITFTLYGSK